MSRLPSQAEVVIVGAGPSGLATAVGLAYYDINTVVLDANAIMHDDCRATGIQARTVELLEPYGVAEAIVKASLPSKIAYIKAAGRTILECDFHTISDTKFPMYYGIAQSTTESILYTRLRELGGDVYRGKKVVELRMNDDGEYREVILESGEVIKARYVIGADGNKSMIRNTLGIPYLTTKEFDSAQSSSEFLEINDDFGTDHVQYTSVDVELVPGEPKYPDLTMLIGNGTVVWMPLPDGTVRLLMPVAPNLVPPKFPDLEYVRRLVSERSCEEDAQMIARVIWGSRFRCRARMAQKCFVSAKGVPTGGVFLVGDAAHCNSPAGGQGLNLGIRDGILLAEALYKEQSGMKGVCSQWEKDRQRAAKRVIFLTNGFSYIWSRRGWLGRIRDVVFLTLGSLPWIRRLPALAMTGFWVD